jgi:Ion transport protein
MSDYIKSFENDHTSEIVMFWIFFYIVTILDVIVLLNLLIAVISDSFDKI